MDLNDIWQGHKKFILAVGGAAIAFLVAKAIIGSTWDVDSLSSNARSTSTQLKKLAAASPAELSAVQAQCSDLRERLAELQKRMEFTTAPEYLLPEGKNADLVFNEVRARAQEELIGKAARRNIRVDESLGMPQFTPSGREAIQRSLRALNVVEKVVEAAVAAEVRSVDGIEVTEARTRKRTKDDAFIDALPVRFNISGRATALAALLEQIGRAEAAFLAVEDVQMELDPKSPFGLATLKLTVAALAFEAEVEAPAGART